ncbi:K02A2.6-like, partial [Cordylochernes scorpioides]
MEQGGEENPKEPMKTDPDYESGDNPTFPKKENTLGRTQEVPPGQEDVTPPAAGVRCPREVDDDATAAFCRDRTSREVESLRWFVRGAELLHQLQRPSRSGPTTILYKTEKATKPPASTPPSYPHASDSTVKVKASLQEDDVPIDDTPQEKRCEATRDNVSRLQGNPWQKHVRSMSVSTIFASYSRQDTHNERDHNEEGKDCPDRKEPRSKMEEQTNPSNDTAEQTIPKQETTLEEEETSPPQDTSADPLTQIADALSKLLVARSPREIDVSPYDGTFEAQSFFDNFDAQADRTELTYTDRLRKLPCYLQGKPLQYFRSLRLDRLYYIEARQRLIDLFPATTEASFARFLAIKMTPQMSLEDYYQNKTVMGMKLDLPADILIESLTDGLPVADQRLVATVQPNTIKEWFDLVSRITQCATSAVNQRQVDKAPHPTYHNPPPRYNSQRPSRVTYPVTPPPSPCKYCNAMHWHSQCGQRFPRDQTRPVYSARPHTTTVPKRGTHTQPKVQPPNHVPQVQAASQDDSASPASSSTSCLHVADSTPIICSPPISPTHDIEISIPSNAAPQLEHCPHELHRILYEFSQVFSTNKYNVPKLNIPPVKINTTTDKIIALRPYRVPLHDQQEIQTQIEQMLQYGIIAPSVSPYASPITLVTKRDQTKRFCIDYRKLNEIIAPDVHPLPLIETILDKLSKAKYYSSVDIASAYWQVEIEPNSRNLLAFVTLDSQYEFCRLPYGFKNSPQIYHRAINQVMQKYKLNFVTHYFDDFIIFSDTLEDHLQHLQQFLTVCQHENIKLNYNKCSFFKTKIDFLGYTVTAGTYAPQTRNLDTINAIKTPYNQKTLQSFLGAVNVYNKFIADYARLRAPLNKLLKKDVKWNWNTDCQQAFITLKESLTSKPVLHLYQVGLPCRLYCDASTQGIAGILKQVHPDGQIHPVQYFSRALRAHERNYTVSELECLAIVESVDKFRIYLTGIKFTIYTDHQALQWLKTIKNPSGRLFRWSLRLSTYNYEIHYIKGSQQYEADLLSRNPFVGFISTDIIKQHQPTASPFNIDTNGLHTITRKGVTKIIIPETLQHTLMNKVHQEYNHPGISQMTRIITTQYYWKGISKSIEKFVRSCHTCQIIKRPKGKPYGALGQIPPPQQPFDLISIDTIAGFSKYGHSKTYLHVIVDHLTRYAWTFPSKSTSTLTYIQTLKTVLQQGSPKRLLSDRAPAFTSEKFRKFLIMHGIQPLLTTSNNPQANGLIERLNATITGKLRLAYLENPKASWTQLVKRVTQTYNNTPHSVTSFPPTYLMFNVIPPDLRTHLNPYPEINIAREIASSRTQNKHKKDKETFDKQHRTPHFEENDLVLVKNYRHPDTGKLAPYFTGPHKIIEIISPNVVRIDRPNQPLNRDSDTIHVNKLKYYTEDVLYITPPQPRFVQHPQRLPQDVYFIEFNHLTPDIFETQYFRIIPPTSSQPFLHLNPSDFIKECLIKAAEIVCPGSVKTLQAISLSRNTVVERVTDMARDLNDQIKEKSSCFEAFSIACDESTNIGGVAQLAVFFFRACDTDFNIFEELLELVPMHGTTTGEDIYNCVYDLLRKYNLPQSKLTSVATDGAPSKTGKTNGFVALLRKKLSEISDGSNIHHTHCIIHQEVLCTKVIKMENVLTPIKKFINFIRSRGLNQRQFSLFLTELESECSGLSYYTEVRWLSCSKVLKQFWDLKEEICQFLITKNQEITLFSDQVWLQDFSFMVDITKHLPDINLKLQGKDQIITNMCDQVNAFKCKLVLWEKQLKNEDLMHFPTCNMYKSSLGETASYQKYAEKILSLRNEFETSTGNSLQPFVPGTNPSEAWGKWKKRFQMFYIATEIDKKSIPRQRAILLYNIGELALDIYSTFKIQETDASPTVPDILELFDGHFKPYKNTTYKRYQFFTTEQGENQNFDDYVTELKNKSMDCEFGELADSLVRDRIIIGIKDKALKERMLQDPDLSLAKAIDLGRATETSRQQVKNITREDVDLHSIKYKKQYKKNFKYPVGRKPNVSEEHPNAKVCQNCGSRHPYGKCFAYGKICNSCKKPNHFAKMCRNRVHMLEERAEEEEEMCLQYLSLDSITGLEWTKIILVENNSVNFKLDTGAQVNILPLDTIKNWQNKPCIYPTGIAVYSYTGEKVPIRGKCKASCTSGKKSEILEFLVVDLPAPPILGLAACKKLELILKVESLEQDHTRTKMDASPTKIIESYRDVFDEIGTLPGEHSVILRENAHPRIQLARRIPFALKKPVEMELKSMEEQKIISKVDQPAEWAHPMVIIKKPNGKVRICMDPRELNPWIKMEYRQLPAPEGIIADITKSPIYTVLDAKSAFWQIKLDEKSSSLLTMATPYGYYRFHRLPFGICSAPEVFYKKMQSMFTGIEGVKVYMDDIIIYGNSLTEHNSRLITVLEIARKNNLKFEFNKMQLAQEKVKFIGHEISKNGISADPSKLEAIQKIKRPMDKTSLQRFLGTVNYLAKFMHNLADKTVLLRQLLKKNTLWTWNEAIEKEFIELKNLVSNPPVLGLFDPHRKVTLSVDASQHGLGAVLMQEGRPIAFASASLNNTQKKYAQIEKELLALWYGCQRFNYHLYGRKFTAQTDHKPLLAILKKPLEELSPRLERLVLKLMRYDFNLEYVPGKVIHTADTLSRDSISEETIDTSDLDLQNTIMTLNLKVTTKRYQEILRDMESDEEMIKLRDHILNGWPIHKKSVDYAVKPYWHCKEELYIWKDLICRGQRLVIPKVQRESILQTLHMSHQGISACKNRAHEAIYWPGLDREIEEMVYKCRICQESQPSQRKEPLIPHEIADYPWQKVAIDFFYLDQSVFIIIVDYYSSFPEVIKVASTSAKEILPVLKSTFARHGIPEIIITDNGPPFTSQDFTNFTNEWDIEHKTSSPGYPKSNGLVERMVQTVKKQLKKCRQDNTDPYMCLIALRTTPSNNLPSPAQMLMGRNLRTLIPMKTTKLKPAFISTENILQQKRENQYKMKEYYDRNAKILPKMSSGEQVNAKTSNAWRPATIIGEANQPRSYIIQNNEGRMLKRNRVHLRPRSYPVGQRRSSQSSPQLDPAPSTSSESSGQREPGEFPRLNLSPEELAPSTSTPIGNYNEGGTAYTTRSGRVVPTCVYSQCLIGVDSRFRIVWDKYSLDYRLETQDRIILFAYGFVFDEEICTEHMVKRNSRMIKFHIRNRRAYMM